MNHEVILNIIKERRSIRKYTNEKVPMKILKLLIEAARWAPSAGNLQPWKFILITDDLVVDALKLISPGMLRKPPSLIILCHDESRMKLARDLQLLDLGAAMQNILLYAHSLNLGTCPIASSDCEGIAEILELPTHIKPILLIAVGRPAEKPNPPARLPLNEIIIREFKGE